MPGKPAGRGRAGAKKGRPESPGRSADSPGHLKKAAGEQSARDFAPGRADRPDADEAGKPKGRGRGLLDRLFDRG